MLVTQSNGQPEPHFPQIWQAPDTMARPHSSLAGAKGHEFLCLHRHSACPGTFRDTGGAGELSHAPMGRSLAPGGPLPITRHPPCWTFILAETSFTPSIHRAVQAQQHPHHLGAWEKSGISGPILDLPTQNPHAHEIPQ